MMLDLLVSLLTAACAAILVYGGWLSLSELRVRQQAPHAKEGEVHLTDGVRRP